MDLKSMPTALDFLRISRKREGKAAPLVEGKSTPNTAKTGPTPMAEMPAAKEFARLMMKNKSPVQTPVTEERAKPARQVIQESVPVVKPAPRTEVTEVRDFRMDVNRLLQEAESTSPEEAVEKLLKSMEEQYG